jgi:putative glycosyltransferase
MSIDISVVTTMYYSASYLHEFCARVRKVVEPVTTNYEIVLINDGSPDDSLEVALGLFRADSHIRVVDLSRNFGHHKAMMTGVAHAHGNLVFLIDCDLEEPPESFTLLYETMQQTQADVVYGVQAQRKEPLLTRITGRLYYTLFNALASYPIDENLLTARLMTARYVQQLIQFKEHLFSIEGLWQSAGFKQVPVTINKDRHKGSSTYTFGKKVTYVVNSITAFSNKPLIYIAYLGILMTGISGVYILALLYQYFVLNYRVDGYTSLMVSMWFLAGLIILILGIISIYLSVIFIEVKQRPYSIVRAAYDHQHPSAEETAPQRIAETTYE